MVEAPYTTDTLYAGLQLIQPGETTSARHVAFALRFIIEGERGFTAVEGQKIESVVLILLSLIAGEMSV